jgi:hypothetical protein
MICLQHRRFLRALLLSLLLFLAWTSEARQFEAQDLDLVIEVMGRTQLRLSPLQYDESVLNAFYALDPAQQEEFLNVRRENLDKLLKRVRSRVVTETAEDLPEPGWFARRVLALIQSVDLLLFQNANLITAPVADIGHIYSGQIATYWGFGDKAIGLAFELTFLSERLADGQTRRSVFVESPRVIRTYLPVPIASGSLRFIRYRTRDSSPDPLAEVKVDHMPLGFVATKGQNHFGLGYLLGFSVPPFPIGTVSGFVTERQYRKVLYPCESKLTSDNESEIKLD